VPHKWLMTLDTYANATYGRAIGVALVAGTCVRCGQAAHRFTTTQAAAQYLRRGLCEPCQHAQTSMADTLVPFKHNHRNDAP
jgi:hypothetical protein